MRKLHSKIRGRRSGRRGGLAISRCLEALESRQLMSGNISVSVINDLNHNGASDAGEGGLSGWTVFVDDDKDGVLDTGELSAVTDGAGKALFSNLRNGKADVREILPSGWQASPGTSDLVRVNVSNNVTTEATFYNSNSLPTTGSASGVVWNDINGDGIRQAEDVGIGGWTVFIDANANKTRDPGEAFAVTDAGGNYLISGLAPGTYKVREVTPSGWDPTLGFDGQNTVSVTAGGNAVSNFGNFNVASIGSINGTVWNDVNADGLREAGDVGMSGWTVFLDLNADGVLNAGEVSTVTDAAGAYAFNSVVVGNYRVAEVLQDGWNLSPGHPAGVNVTVVKEGTPVVDFANFTPALGSVSGKVWNDLNGDGSIGASEPGLAGWTVFIDQDGDGAVGAGEPSVVTDGSGNYVLSDVPVGSDVIREVAPVGWSATAPGTGMQLVLVRNATAVPNINFGNKQRTDGAISGTVYFDADHDGVKDAAEHGLAGITVYLDTNDNGVLDSGEASVVSSADLFYTPGVDETGTYSFTHLPAGNYHVREILPAVLSGTPLAAREAAVALAVGEDRRNVNFADQFRANEIHGMVFDDSNQNHVRDAGEAGLGGVTIYLDLNRDNLYQATEPRTVTAGDGTYSFSTGLAAGSYVIRELRHSGREHSYPTTTGGILWPSGVSNAAVGNVTPGSITTSLAEGQSEHDTVSLTLPGTGSLTNMVDVFLLFDDTGSFTGNSPIVRAAFPQIISALQTAMPGVDFGFGVGRFEEYANFASEFSTGRPFILNQPIVDQNTPGFAASIAAALDRTAPGYGGDQPETDIEALYQLATGRGFDGNNNGTTTDSGAAGLVGTQVTPGDSGDVPAFGSFTVDAAGNVLPAAGSVGGAGFRAGALPIVLVATDTGFAFQPAGETSITGVNGLTLPISALTQTSRPTTPFGSGAGIQQTITALNALGALVIGLGTNSAATVDPRQGLEAISKLTGAINRSSTTIANGTLDPIAPGDPFYFQISSGFGASVSNGIVSAIENGLANVALNITVKASDPRVHLGLAPGVVNNVGAGQTATFDVTFTGDGRPHRFDLQFVREGTDVVLGSIPVVMGTPIVGDGYEYEDLEDGQIAEVDDFGSWVNPLLAVNVAPSYAKGPDENSVSDGTGVTVSGWATGISKGAAWEGDQLVDFEVSNDNAGLFSVAPAIGPDGTLTYTPLAGASGMATVSVRLRDTGGTVGGGVDVSGVSTFTIRVVAPVTAASRFDYLTKSLVVDFSGDVAGSLSATTVQLINLATNLPVTLPAGSYDAALHRLTFGGLSLANGNYRVVISPGAVAGMTAGHPFDFFVMAGDFNLDRTVDFNDLVVLAQHYNTAVSSYAEGDANGDGVVDFNDLVAVAQNYNTTLAAPGAAGSVVVAASAPVLIGARAAGSLVGRQTGAGGLAVGARPVGVKPVVSRPAAVKPVVLKPVKGVPGAGKKPGGGKGVFATRKVEAKGAVK